MKSPWMSEDLICELFVRLDTFFHAHGQAAKHNGDKSAKLSAIRLGFRMLRMSAPSCAGPSYVVKVMAWQIV